MTLLSKADKVINLKIKKIGTLHQKQNKISLQKYLEKITKILLQEMKKKNNYKNRTFRLHEKMKASLEIKKYKQNKPVIILKRLVTQHQFHIYRTFSQRNRLVFWVYSCMLKENFHILLILKVSTMIYPLVSPINLQAK